MEEEFDLSQVKVIDENGEAQPVEIPKEEEQTEQEETKEENTENETEVADTPENETEVEETKEETVEEPAAESEEPAEGLDRSEGDESADQATADLFEQLDGISKDLTGGKVDNLEDFFEEYKRMRDSSATQFKDDYIKNAVEYYNKTGSLTPYLEATSVNYEEMSDEQIMRRELEQANPSLSAKASLVASVTV